MPKDRAIVACRCGTYCLLAVNAVALLQQEGYSAVHLREDVAEWAVTSR